MIEENKNIEMEEEVEENIEETLPENNKKEGEKIMKKEAGKDKKEKKEKIKKNEAIVRGKDLHMSTKHSVAICDFIRGKRIEEAIEDLEKVVSKRKAIHVKEEAPHKKGMERGRYLVKASGIFIMLLKSLSANSSVAGLEEPYIFIAKADIASRPYKRFGSQRFKRSHVLLIAKEIKQKVKKKKEKEEKEKK